MRIDENLRTRCIEPQHANYGSHGDVKRARPVLRVKCKPEEGRGCRTPLKPSEYAGKGTIPWAEISDPVGVTEEGKAIFAHVRFDAPLKKGMLSSLRQLLDALEKNLS